MNSNGSVTVGAKVSGDWSGDQDHLGHVLVACARCLPNCFKATTSECLQ